MSDLEEIIRLINEEDDFIITSHIDPDGDNIASQLALYSILTKMGKHVTLLDNDPVPERYAFMLNDEVIHHEISDDKNYSAAFVVDVANLKRTGKGVSTYIDENVDIIVNIDHHRSNEYFGTYNYVDPHSSAAAVLVFKIANALGIEWDSEIATRIYAGIMTDTGGFRYPNTNQETFRIVTDLVNYGANPGDIAYHIYSQRPFPVIKLIVEALSTLTLHYDEKVALMKLTEEHYKRADAQSEHSEGLINYASSIKGVYVAVLLRENDTERIRVSLRSNGQVDVDKIARVFGGGGHKNAAGCRIEATIGEVEKILLAEIEKFL